MLPRQSKECYSCILLLCFVAIELDGGRGRVGGRKQGEGGREGGNNGRVGGREQWEGGR